MRAARASRAPFVGAARIAARAGLAVCVVALALDIFGARAAMAATKPPVPASFLPYDAGWLEVAYPPSARDRVAPLVAHADEARSELANLLGTVPVEGIELRVARGADEMSALAPDAPPRHASSYGMSYPDDGLIVVSLGLSGGEPIDLVRAFRRELAYVALRRATAQTALPRWLDEGFALQFGRSGGGITAPLEMGLAAARRQLLRVTEIDTHLEALDARAPLAQLEAADWVRFLLAPERRRAFTGTIARLAAGEPIEAALAASYGRPLPALEAAWRRDLARRLSWMAAAFLAFVGLLASTIVLFARRRRKRALSPLHALPEAREDRRRNRAAPLLDEGGGRTDRIHIVFSRRDDHADPALLPDAEVPKIEHDGEWHTLH